MPCVQILTCVSDAAHAYVRIFAIFLLERREQMLHGIRLPMPNSQHWMLCCRFGGVVSVSNTL